MSYLWHGRLARGRPWARRPCHVSFIDVRYLRWHILLILRRLASILLILAFVGIGSGAIEYWHNLDNQTSHDEANCPTHAILRAPGIVAAAAPVLCISDVHSARVIVLPASLPSQHAPARID